MDEVRLKANLALNPKNKVTLGQFMTPSVIADYMASLFIPVNKEVRLIDCGPVRRAGIRTNSSV